MADEIVVLVSCPQLISESIAKTIIEEKLAACVSILPQVKSIYIWKEKLCQEEECLLFIKSTSAVWLDLEKKILSLHTSEVPEILVLNIEIGHSPYLDWLNNSVAPNRI